MDGMSREINLKRNRAYVSCRWCREQHEIKSGKDSPVYMCGDLKLKIQTGDVIIVNKKGILRKLLGRFSNVKETQ